MERARSVLMRAAFVGGVIVLVGLMIGSLDNPQWFVLIDLIWKVLVLLLLIDISVKLGSYPGAKDKSHH